LSNTKSFEHEDIVNLDEVLWRNNNQNQQNRKNIFDKIHFEIGVKTHYGWPICPKKVVYNKYHSTQQIKILMNYLAI
jgi:hypothetical protein